MPGFGRWTELPGRTKNSENRYIVEKTSTAEPLIAPIMKRLFVAVVAFAVVASLAILPAFAAAKSAFGPLSFGIHRYERHAASNAETSLSCEYPVFGASVAGEAINGTILTNIIKIIPGPESAPPAATLDEAATRFIGEYEKVRASQKEYLYTWEAMVTGEVLLDQPRLVTVSIDSYFFTGGAHGMTLTQNMVFDAATGKQLGLADFFAPGFETALDRLIDIRFRQMRGLAPGDTLTGEKGGLFENVIRHNENFAVTGSGIRFLYNQYDIAPYAAGQITIDLSFDELKGILKPLSENK